MSNTPYSDEEMEHRLMLKCVIALAQGIIAASTQEYVTSAASLIVTLLEEELTNANHS